jgi:hypothetical protein
MVNNYKRYLLKPKMQINFKSIMDGLYADQAIYSYIHHRLNAHYDSFHSYPTLKLPILNLMLYLQLSKVIVKLSIKLNNFLLFCIVSLWLVVNYTILPFHGISSNRPNFPSFDYVIIFLILLNSIFSYV